VLTYPQIDPVAFHIGSWPVYWYGLMYLVGFLGGWILLILRSRLSRQTSFTEEQISDIVFYTALGAIVGGRLGYMFFYDWRQLWLDPLELMRVWHGGMSFHGGLLGVFVALFCYARKLKKPFLMLTDLVAPVVPIGLGAGRIGNFINGELWGRVTTSPLGMVFPQADSLPRHPSQLYESFLEGVVLFTILWVFSRKPRPCGAVSGLFLLGYGVFRTCIEFFREPDAGIGYIAFQWLTEGQLLSLPMIVAGILLIIWSYRKRVKYAAIS
jgi:phosphatidylglycerol:prolipoprotein diacylglycerol transferase